MPGSRTGGLKDVLKSALGFVAMLGCLVVPVALFVGAARFGAWALPFIAQAAVWATLLGLPVFILIAFPASTRRVAGYGFLVTSYLYGASIWIWSLLFTLQTWGLLAVVIGVLMAGVGIVQIAMLAAGFHSQWGIIGQLVLGLVLTIITRTIGTYLIGMAEDRASRLADATE